MISVICWKWGNKIHEKKNLRFSHHHVNFLYNMVKKNLHIPFEMVCITDNTQGINKDIRILPIWDDFVDKGGCFRRLKVFHKNFKNILGNDRFVTIDLDTIIVNDITSIIDRPDDFIIWGEEWRKWVYCGSMWMMDCGSRPHVWKEFKKNHRKYEINKNGKYSGGTDQKHINICLYPLEKTWSEEDGVYSFRTDIMKWDKRKTSSHGKKKIYGGDGNLPKNAKIIFFNGQYDPSQLKLQREYPWIKEYWR